jgi:hypothetical protein
MVEPDESVTDADQRFRFFDPATGDSLESESFEASPTMPPAFPPDWPFVPNHDCVITRTVVQDRPFSVMFWVVEDDERLLRSRIDHAMGELGWHQHEPTESRSDETDLLMWYHLGEEWRVLGRRSADDVVALVLSERRLDLFPPSR